MLLAAAISFSATSASAQFLKGLKEASRKDLSKPPVVQPVPVLTSKLFVTIRGKTFPGAYVFITGGSSPAGIMADPSTGEFEIDVFLRPETINKLSIRAIDRRGRTTPSTVVEIQQTLTPAEAPIVYTYEEYTNKTMVDIHGRTRPGYKVVAYGGRYPSTAKASETGDFTISVYLNANATNRIRIAAVDRVGNMSPFTEIEIVHDSVPPYPPAVTRYPTKTRKTLITVEGTAEPSAKVVFEGTVKKQTIPVDEYGHFKGLLEIEKFTLSSRVNRIYVYAVDRAGNKSEPTEIIITHVHFFKKHMLHVRSGFHIYPPSDFLTDIQTKPSETLGPALEVSYDYVFKAPFSIGASVGTYGSLGNTVLASYINTKYDIYTVAFYVLLRPSLHFMLEKFDIYLTVSGGFLNLVKIVQTRQGTSSSTNLNNFQTWLVKFSVGVDYYFRDEWSVGIEESYGVSYIPSANEIGSYFDPGGNVITINAGYHF